MKIQKLILVFGIFTTIVFFSGHSIAVTRMVYSQSGDVTSNSAVLWGRCNQEQDTQIKFTLFTAAHKHQHTPHQYQHVQEKVSKVSAKTDYTRSVIFKGLEPNTQYHYQVECKSLGKDASPTASGMMSNFTTPPSSQHAGAVRFVWVADLAGQGWGRNPHLSIKHIAGDLIQGGYVVFASMSKLNPDFALFQGDMIYADVEIPPRKKMPVDVGGGIWINKPSKDFVAIALDDFRANWKYNLGDKNMAHFLAKTPVYVQWDDHEVANNWYPGKIMPEDAPYFGMTADELAKTAKQALLEFNPIKHADLFRSFQYGKHMELFLLDERSYRGANSDNDNPNGIEMLGQAQLNWLKDALKNSQATWKIISTHDPLSIVTGGVTDRDAWGQNDAAILGREVQLAEILKFLKDHDIKNVVFLTSDVHFAAAISYEPARATFKDFNPFWEFVIGPINAGAFGAGNLDASFGPKYEYLRAPSTEGIGQNSPPPYLQSFGLVEISIIGELTVKLIDITGSLLFKKRMVPL